MNDLVIGAWRNGITAQLKGDVAFWEERQGKGFTLLPPERTIVELSQMLDTYDDFAGALLTGAMDAPPPLNQQAMDLADSLAEKDLLQVQQDTLLSQGFVPNNYERERLKQRGTKASQG